ncbi:MAG: restriction endonuclease subunit S [Thiobacillus sp.]
MSSKTKTTATKEEARPALVPKLRFPEFRGAGDWTTETLGAVAKIGTEKVGDNTCIPMSITSGVGLVSQVEKFGRIIAGSSYANYLLLKKNDFAYNKSATKEYPEGFIALYTENELAAVPNSIFTCFRIKGESPVPQYLNYLFLGNLHGKWLRKFIEVGARAHGSLSINDGDLLALPVPLPSGKTSVPEQQKIAECLSSVDELMAAQARKVDALKTHKKGLIQQLFPREGETQPRLRFPEFQNAGEWEYLELDSFLLGHTERVSSNTDLPIYSSTRTGLKSQKDYFNDRELENDGEYGVVPEGYFVYRHMSDDGTFKFNINKTGGKIVVSKEYPVFTTVDLHSEFLLHLLNNGGGFREFALAQKKGGTRTRLYLKVLRTWKALMPSYSEQQRIASCLSSLDALITAETQKLEALKTHKKGLMQQLFPSPEEVEA